MPKLPTPQVIDKTKEYTAKMAAKFPHLAERLIEEKEPKKLRPRPIVNTNWLDLRIRDVSSGIIENVKVLSPRDNIVRPPTNSIVSKPWITKVSEAEYRISFAINIHNLLVRSSMWQNIVKLVPADTFKSMYVPENINEILVYRHKAGEPDVLVGQPTNVSLEVADDVLHYTITDAGVKGDGEYHYSIRITYLDPIHEWMMERVSNLVMANQDIQRYRNECVIKGKSDPQTGLFNEAEIANLRALLEQYKRALPILFDNLMDLGLVSSETYKDKLTAVVQALHPNTGSPETIEAVMDGINIAVQYASKLLGETDVGTPNYTSGNSATVTATGGKRGKSASKTQSMTIELNEPLKISRASSRSYAEYIQVPKSGYITRTDIYTRTQLELRRLFTDDAETFTYKGDIANVTDSVQATAHMYFAPIILKVGHRDAYPLFKNDDKDLFNQLFVDLLSTDSTNEPYHDLYSPSKNIKLSERQQTLKNRLVNAFSNVGATVEFDSGMAATPASSILNNAMTKQQGVSISQRLVGSARSKNKVAPQPSKEAEANDPLLALLCLDNIELNKYSLSNYNMSLPANKGKLSSQLSKRADKATFVKALPNHIKFLIKKNDKDSVTRTDNVLNDADFLRDPTRFYYAWNTLLNLRQLLRLTGYKKDGENVSLVNAPTYAPVLIHEPKVKFDFCVLTPYKNTAFGVYDEPLLELPALNEHFVIDNTRALQEVNVRKKKAVETATRAALKTETSAAPKGTLKVGVPAAAKSKEEQRAADAAAKQTTQRRDTTTDRSDAPKQQEFVAVQSTTTRLKGSAPVATSGWVTPPPETPPAKDTSSRPTRTTSDTAAAKKSADTNKKSTDTGRGTSGTAKKSTSPAKKSTDANKKSSDIVKNSSGSAKKPADAGKKKSTKRGR